MMYDLVLTKPFLKEVDKYCQKEQKLRLKIRKALILLSQNPHFPALKSHKVQTRKLGIHWSSFLTGYLRLVWNFDKNAESSIIVMDIGGHSGKGKVYK